MCWSDFILLWTNLPGVMGSERSLRISLLTPRRRGTWAAVRGTTSARSLLGRIVGAVAQLQEKIAAEEPARESRSAVDRRRARLRRLGADDGRGWLRRRHWCKRCSQRKNSAEDKLPHHAYCLLLVSCCGVLSLLWVPFRALLSSTTGWELKHRCKNHCKLYATTGKRLDAALSLRLSRLAFRS